MYDKLCINKRQKKDHCYTEILNEVRCGSVTQDSYGDHCYTEILNEVWCGSVIQDSYRRGLLKEIFCRSTLNWPIAASLQFACFQQEKLVKSLTNKINVVYIGY